MDMLLMLLPMILIFYFMLIRPESKRKKEAEQLRSSIKNGDKITTIGGIMGTVVDVKTDSFVIETSADQVRVEFAKWALSTNDSATAAAKEEAKKRTLELLADVGIPEPERRYKQYPHEFSGGMRQRVVIAIAMACVPEILICDEPTTALDVTIQAQILDLLRKLQSKYGLTVIYITHDLGVVANVADRIAVMYAGDIVEIGNCDEVFYDPKHPYTWALLSSLPQLGIKGEDLYAIKGTPPNLFQTIKGDAFAPRNPRALKIDFVARPPYFDVTPTHRARTWLLDPRSPQIDPPAIIKNIRNIKRGGAENG